METELVILKENIDLPTEEGPETTLVLLLRKTFAASLHGNVTPPRLFLTGAGCSSRVGWEGNGLLGKPSRHGSCRLGGILPLYEPLSNLQPECSSVVRSSLLSKGAAWYHPDHLTALTDEFPCNCDQLL